MPPQQQSNPGERGLVRTRVGRGRGLVSRATPNSREGRQVGNMSPSSSAMTRAPEAQSSSTFFSNASRFDVRGARFEHYNGPSINVTVNTSQPQEGSELVQSGPSGSGSSSAPVRTAGNDQDTGSIHEQYPPMSNKPVPRLQQPLPIQRSCDIYFRHLCVKGRGSPLWLPGTNFRLSIEHRRKGIDVGDLGLITRFGGFDFLFNILLAVDDPIHADQTPDNFSPIHPPLRPEDIYEQEEFIPDSYLASSSVKKAQQDGQGSSTGLTFETTDSEGAILAIPQGSDSKDLLSVGRFRKYLAENAENWYRYVNGERGREAQNGDLRLVTGCDKAKAWGMATFSHLSSTTAHTSFQLNFKPLEETGQTYGWEYSGVAEGRAGPSSREIAQLRLQGEPDDVTFANQCLFIRTLNVSLQEDVWERLEATEFGTIDAKDSSNSETKPGAPDVFPKGKMKVSDPAPEAHYTGKSGTSSVVQASDLTTTLPYHPATLLNAYLLQENPDARVAITEDINWMSVLTEDDHSLPPATQILQRIMKTHDICKEEGVVYLEPKINRAKGGEPALPLHSTISAVDKSGDATEKGLPTRLRTRPRTNTTSFASSLWRRSRGPAPTATPPPLPAPAPVILLEALIQALTPPAVPSFVHARALASSLSTCSPLPRRELLYPVLTSLCRKDSPASLQAAGFDILAAYCENDEAPPLGTSERFSYFSLFLGAGNTWQLELWEPRFKALRSLTKNGEDILGIESNLVDLVERWIEGAFEGLLQAPVSLDPAEKAERERSFNLLVQFFGNVLTVGTNASRITDEKMAAILHFHGNLVDRALVVEDFAGEPPSALVGTSSAGSGHPVKKTHQRNSSSMSSTSTPTPSSISPAIRRHPAELAVNVHLHHVSTQIKTLPAIHLNSILPVLFRALGFSLTPLPPLSTMSEASKKDALEDRVMEMLNSLFGGPYSTSCMLILRCHLFPPDPTSNTAPSSLRLAMMTSLGAHRVFRNYVRRALSIRLARAYINRETAIGHSSPGPLSHMELHSELAHSIGKGDNGWDARNLGRKLTESVEAWVEYKLAIENWGDLNAFQEGRDDILEEAAGVLKDILRELELRDAERGILDEEEAGVIEVMLLKLASYVLLLKNADGTPLIVTISSPHHALTRVLRTISTLFGRDHSRALNPLLPNILIHIAEHLTDMDTANLPRLMMDRLDLYPTSLKWLDNWENLLGTPALVSPSRPYTRREIMDALQTVYDGVKDMKVYRRPLADIIWKFFNGLVGSPGGQSNDADVIWKIIGQEVVLRSNERSEDDTADADSITTFLDLLVSIASKQPHDEEGGTDTALGTTGDINTLVAKHGMPPSTSISPNISPVLAEPPTPREEERMAGMPSVLSILSSPRSGRATSRLQSVQPDEDSEIRTETFMRSLRSRLSPSPTPALISCDVSATATLVEIFSQLVFTPFSLVPKILLLAVEVYRLLLRIVTEGQSTRARLAALQFLMRIRADRAHNLYYESSVDEPNGLVASLGALINRCGPSAATAGMLLSDRIFLTDARTPQANFAGGRDGWRPSKGRGLGGPARSTPSRSQRQTTEPPLQPAGKPLETLWHIPEVFPFNVSNPDLPSEMLGSYDPEGLDGNLVLPTSSYLLSVNHLLEKETSWEILSYVLCHLPVQLANKHLFCGPKSRQAMPKLLDILCTGIVSGKFASQIEQWPIGSKVRDAYGLAYETLSVLISYRSCLDLKQRHLLIETFQAGLNGTAATIKCCLHSLSLSAFELQSSMTRHLSRILEKLSQIMSNPSMSVHILSFLSIVGSLTELHVNFTESDFKMVFGIALQFLQQYNRVQLPRSMSWALVQHVRMLSYCVVYTWFLSVKLPDRPRHVRYITRQLLLANEGNAQVDGPTEVCFDWLARYTYGSADPRPANSVFSDIVTNPANPGSEPQAEKTWIMGNSVVHVRSVACTGWVEVISRRPSGYSKFVCRVENVPMVGSGDVAPDLLSVPAGLLMERYPPHTIVQSRDATEEGENMEHLRGLSTDNAEEAAQPDPITGYVWSGTAPSQRRKHVEIDPSFLILQLSPFPDGTTKPYVKRVHNQPAISRFVRSLDHIPVIDTHKVGILYVAPGQTNEEDILRNAHGSPAYTRFLEGIGRLINLRNQVDVYAGGLDADEDGEYAYAWWDDIGQILYHTATMMPTTPQDPACIKKKRHIGNDYARIVWNDSGSPYHFDTLKTQFQFVNIVIEPHSVGALAAFSNNLHENEYFKVTIQSAPGMAEFAPIGFFKLISAENLPLFVRQLSLLADRFASVFAATQRDTERVEVKTNWHTRLETIRRLKSQLPQDDAPGDILEGVMGQEALRDFTTSF